MQNELFLLDLIWFPPTSTQQTGSSVVRRAREMTCCDSGESKPQSSPEWFGLFRYMKIWCERMSARNKRAFEGEKKRWLSLARYINSWLKWKTTSVLIRKQCFQAEGPILFAVLSRGGWKKFWGLDTGETALHSPSNNIVIGGDWQKLWGKLL